MPKEEAVATRVQEAETKAPVVVVLPDRQAASARNKVKDKEPRHGSIPRCGVCFNLEDRNPKGIEHAAFPDPEFKSNLIVEGKNARRPCRGQSTLAHCI